ncbi:uncharacterized protein LOC108961042 [Eucalyptus grandis]|uniref:uncharacterized protein LOC108961042 n=1 Tax=Eucalyptus grandis TaxID=71139 RepID=UPI0008A0DED7|nr:uncharacterized protein LOC108961042 [Eucalyptus grandis]
MESKKIRCLPTLVFSLLLIENVMASRVLAASDPIGKRDKSIPFRVSPPGGTAARGSPPLRDNHWSSVKSDRGEVREPPPGANTMLSGAGRRNKSARSVAVAPTTAKVKVSTAVSPTSATSREQRP